METLEEKMKIVRKIEKMMNNKLFHFLLDLIILYVLLYFIYY